MEPRIVDQLSCVLNKVMKDYDVNVVILHLNESDYPTSDKMLIGIVGNKPTSAIMAHDILSKQPLLKLVSFKENLVIYSINQ